MSENELSDFKEIVHNGEPIDWDYWASLQKITPHKAAKLAFCIDPHRWNGNQYSGGDVKKGTAIPKDLTKKILDFEVWLEGIKQEWTLQEIARALGENAPVGMIEVLTKSIIVHDIQPLNELTDEERKAYYSQRFCWNWVEAIYILQGFKPVFQISTEQVRSHFPVEFHYFSEALRNGGIGKRTEMAGEVTYEDTIENWQKFWQKYNNAPLDDIEPTKPRKELKPLERETSDGLLLIYEMFDYYSIKYLDEMSAIKAWGRIVSAEFKSEYVAGIAENKKSITLSSGSKLSTRDFSEKYRKRFKPANTNNQQD